jgi:hypothetical protein
MINLSNKLTRVCNCLIIKYVDILFDNAYINKKCKRAHFKQARIYRWFLKPIVKGFSVCEKFF